MVSRRLWFRLDLTKTKAYTISNVSRNLHSEIADIVNISYFLSDKLKTVHTAPQEIEDTLREYAAYSRGKIRVTVRDPVKAGLGLVVEEFGLQPRQFQTVNQDEASLVTVYSGIVIEYLDKTEILPWVLTTDTLEYDLTSRIRSMLRDTERRIGVIIGDSFRQWREDFSFLAQTLEAAGYRVRQIPPGDDIPDTLTSIFVLGGVEELDDWALYRIDRFIRMGGKALFAVKGVYVDTVNGTIEARKQEDKGLLDLIASYGVLIRPELALDRNALSLQYQTSSQSGMRQIRIVRYPLWIGVLADNGNEQHPVSAGFAGLDMFWASPLELHPAADVEVTPLFTSSPQAWTMADNFITSPEMIYMFERDAPQTRGTKILGAAMNGIFSGFFDGSSKPQREGSDEELPNMPRYSTASRIIVIGDTDFATNIINATGARHNLDFLLRTADWLSSDDDIINIRSRQSQTGRLDKIIDTGKRAFAMKFAQIINIGFIPALVIIAGLLFAWRRRVRTRTGSTAKELSDGV
jgi:gliding-associated putative ABC transporter substrate-binding component GldG